MLYYYILIEEPYKTQHTEFLDELVTLLYSGEADFITDAQRIELKLSKNYFSELRKTLSKYSDRIPLYDIHSNHIYLIFKQNVYRRIYEDHYRFVDNHFYEDLVQLDDPSEADKENRKILSYYDLNVLQKTYKKVFYESFVLDSYITNCKRPSFLPGYGMEHISPYYKINEIYYLAYEWNLTDKATLTEEEIHDLCGKISKFDISGKTLLAHQMYIYDSKSIGLVKYYSLYGSYYINLYLRKYRCCLTEKNKEQSKNIIRNPDLENKTEIMCRLIQKAPAFESKHTLYRFVQRDDYIRHLKPGDIYTDPSFMSTTRNPFYYQENDIFGYILIKITIPGTKKGVALCIESYSNFPEEEEIILPPTTQLRLDKIIEEGETEKYHHVLKKKVKRRYEFTWIGNDYISEKTAKLVVTGGEIPPMPTIDLKDVLANETIKYLAMTDRLRYFRETYINVNNQFGSLVNNKNYIFVMEAYESTTVYEKFFYYDTMDGIMITSSNPKYGNINLLLELGPEIHVNYYFKYSVADSSHLVDLDKQEWIAWLAMLSYVVGAQNVIIHSDYVLHYDKSESVKEKQLKTRYTHSKDIYSYLKHKKKRFSQFSIIIPNFDYSRLDYLFGVNVDDYIFPSDRDELYRIYKSSGKKDMGNFYLYIVENFPKFVKILVDKMDLVYPNSEINPFKNISYSFNAWMYLYNANLITSIPSEKEFFIKKGSFRKLIGDNKVKKFKNRLREYLTNE